MWGHHIKGRENQLLRGDTKEGGSIPPPHPTKIIHYDEIHVHRKGHPSEYGYSKK
jgi:hypothetical protein